MSLTGLVVLCGLPGSGKSTLARELASRVDALVLSSDEVRAKIMGSGYDRRKEPLVWAGIRREAIKGLSKGELVVIDAVNAREGWRRAMLWLASVSLRPSAVAYLKVPEEVALSRGKLDEQAFSRVASSFEEPLPGSAIELDASEKDPGELADYLLRELRSRWSSWKPPVRRGSRAAVFDVDGVLVDFRRRWRLAASRGDRFWEELLDPRNFSLDRPREEGIRALRSARERGLEVIFLTGRPERLRPVTERQLEGLDYSVLLMRPDADRRPGPEFKAEALSALNSALRIEEIHDDEERILKALSWIRCKLVLHRVPVAFYTDELGRVRPITSG